MRTANFRNTAKCMALAAMALILASGCRKDLCYDHALHGLSVKVSLNPDWELEWERTYGYNWTELWPEQWIDYELFRPPVAGGIRAVVYRQDGAFTESNLPNDGGMLPLYEGVNEILFYNNDTEYIVFDGLDVSTRASATTRTLTRGGFTDLHEGERTVTVPDQLFGNYIQEYETALSRDTSSLDITMRPLTYKYIIQYRFSKGLEYVALARGALAGMAESVQLTDGHTGDQSATLMFDCIFRDYGTAAVILSFGVPNYPGDHYTRADGSEAKYTLSLQVRLHNGKILDDFVFDVTEQVKEQPRGGVIIVSGIEISDEDGQGGQGGFDVNVDGWGDYVDIPLPL